jgi:uncharacterized membrane protein
VSPGSGSIKTNQSLAMSVSATTSGLAAGTYNGNIVLRATDSVTHLAVGAPQTVAVTFTVLPACTLQTPSTTSLNFSAQSGGSGSSQTFTIGVSGNCSGNVTLNISTDSSGGWLSVASPTISLPSGSQTTITAQANPGSLAAGTYAGRITITALDGSVVLAGSPQLINASLTVNERPKLSVTPGTIAITVASGVTSQPITISNPGGGPLNWSAALSGAPAFVSLSGSPSGSLNAGESATVTLSINATGVAGGTDYTASVVVSATNPLDNSTVEGSPATVAITIHISSPEMQVSTGALNFTAQEGETPATQSLTISNPGGDSLSWTAGAPSQSWLSVSPGGGTNASGVSTPVFFSVQTSGLAPGSYSATVVITASVGPPVTVQVNLTITAAPTPTVDPSPTPT